MSEKFGKRVCLWTAMAMWMCVASAAGGPATEASRFTILVFTKTAGYRHDSIPAGITAIRSLGNEHGFTVVNSEETSIFNEVELAKYRVIVFLNTTGDILNSVEQAALETFIRHGGGFVGIHSATDTEYDWPWYGQLVGAYFQSHPAIQRVVVKRVDSSDASTAALPPEWQRTDEWYNFQDNPRSRVTVLLDLDETTYDGGTMGESHPLAWRHEYDGGRAWYTAMGHTAESYAEPLFLSHILGGIMWAANEALSDPERDPLRTGYLVVNPDPGSVAPAATVTLALLTNGAVQSQAAVTVQPLVYEASLFAEVEAAMGRNVGVAIANPGYSTNTVTITLYRPDGSSAGTSVTMILPERHQAARFLSDIFSDSIPAPVTGSVRIEGIAPLSLIGLRFSGSTFSTIPLRSSRMVIDGSGTLVFPQIAMGGGWATQIALLNNGGETITGHIDIFDTAGNPMSIDLNNTFQNAFAYSIPAAAGGFLFAPRAQNGQPVF